MATRVNIIIHTPRVSLGVMNGVIKFPSLKTKPVSGKASTTYTEITTKLSVLLFLNINGKMKNTKYLRIE